LVQFTCDVLATAPVPDVMSAIQAGLQLKECA
jgi:hypothetical protein